LQKRIARIITTIAAIAVIAIVSVIVLMRVRPQRHRLFRRQVPVAIKGVPPVEQWTDAFAQLPPADLVKLLDQIQAQHPDLYAKWSLGYLHARALIEDNEPALAAKKLAPFLANGNPFRDLALYHQSEIEEGEPASRTRQALIFGYPKSLYRDQAIDEETENLDARRLTDFAAKLYPSADTARRRDLDAHVAERTHSADKALAVLRGGTTDDAAERAAQVLDAQHKNAELVGEVMFNHRHFDRAIALLSSIPSPRPAILYAIGRSYYGAEKYAEAEKAYMRAANATKVPAEKAQYLWHAARAAQLRGDDAGAEKLMTASIAIPGRSPAQTAALTQRIRLRLKQKRIREASADLQLLKKIAPNDHDVVAASMAFLSSGIPVPIEPKLLTKTDRAELAYWHGRMLERSNAHGAFTAFVEAMKEDTPFAQFARTHVAQSPVRAQEIAARDAKIAAAKNPIEAKAIATERFLIAPSGQLAAVYRQIPQYRAVLDAKPSAFPRFPVASSDRATLLMAMGLFDEASDDIPQQWSLLTQSLALNRGNASRLSIFDIERFMKSVPDDYVDDLLPHVVRELLYPRYFDEAIQADSKKFDADPTLVLAIMREESRFNPRAKSEAAARGLLQFIITTARDIGREAGIVDVTPDDLYDPHIIIQLGAKYIGSILAQFNNDHYAASAAYNAGAKQVLLWQRMAPAPGDDALVTAINFDETKDYVRKVMSSYAQYRAIYH
jgi:soluble lytic murein transglycosylase-like protein